MFGTPAALRTNRFVMDNEGVVIELNTRTDQTTTVISKRDGQMAATFIMEKVGGVKAADELLEVTEVCMALKQDVLRMVTQLANIKYQDRPIFLNEPRNADLYKLAQKSAPYDPEFHKLVDQIEQYLVLND